MRDHRFDLVIDLARIGPSGLFAWLQWEINHWARHQREGAHGFHDISVPRPTVADTRGDWLFGSLAGVAGAD